MGRKAKPGEEQPCAIKSAPLTTEAESAPMAEPNQSRINGEYKISRAKQDHLIISILKSYGWLIVSALIAAGWIAQPATKASVDILREEFRQYTKEQARSADELKKLVLDISIQQRATELWQAKMEGALGANASLPAASLSNRWKPQPPKPAKFSSFGRRP